MRGYGFSVEHAGRGQHEHAGANRTQPRATLVSHADSLEQRLGRQFVGIAPTGHHDRIGAVQHLERVRRGDRDAACGPQRAGLACADGKAIPIDPQLGAFQREEFRHAPEFESTKPVVSQRNDKMISHGVMLPKIVIYATTVDRGHAPE
ncbi:hypothetical protein D3C73_801710 [compost metagenome]